MNERKGYRMVVREDFFQRKKRELGISLNEIQRKAVEQTEGSILLLASPGSGKTTTLMMRIGYLIEEKGVDSSRIKAITFSRAAARDMRERFQHFFPHLQSVDFSTIHSFAYEVVTTYFRQKRMAFRMIDGAFSSEHHAKRAPLHKKILLQQLYTSIVGETMTEDQMEELTTYISYIKNKLIPREKWSTVRCDVPKAEQILQKYEKYKRSGTETLLLDFDDMLTVCNQILENEQALLQNYQKRYDYVLTDESQDTSLVQHVIIEKLVQRHNNLCVVADDDQSIYSWRGAEPAYLLNFKQVYPDARILFMEQNYRSSKNIVEVANQFIQSNKNRYKKNMFTENPHRDPIKVVRFSDFISQVKYIVEQVKDAEQLSDVAVLYRNHSSSILLMNEFERVGIPFYLKDADHRFFSHWVVKDMLNFMRMAYTDKRSDIFEALYMKMNGYVTKQQMNAVKEKDPQQSVFTYLLTAVPLKTYQVKVIKENEKWFQKMRKMTPLQALSVIRHRLGYEKALERMSKRLGFRKENLIRMLDTLAEISRDIDTLEAFAARLKQLETAMQIAKRNNAAEAVTFSTLHSSKGLEFERVYMLDLVEGTIPTTEEVKSHNERLMEEARRLFYVGMTRAKRHLELISYQSNDVFESRFVKQVREIIELRKQEQGRTKSHKRGIPTIIPYHPNAIRQKQALANGRVVKHRVFGKGTITHIEEDTLHVQFTKEVKILSIDMCLELGLLELID